jgi:nicotinate-nucleotide pyrophosphorylase (carboxylating)
MAVASTFSDIMQTAEMLVRMAIAEDIRTGDVTSKSILSPTQRAQAELIAKADGVIVGIPIASMVFSRVDSSIQFKHAMDDGTSAHAGDCIAQVEGPAVSLLAAERSALNFLQHLSGVATLTAAYVRAVAGTRAVILDTRKTLPGYRVLEKYAVRMGGGQNHRMGLYDMALIKDNHIAVAGSIAMAVKRVHTADPNLMVEVEVTDLNELREALVMSVDRIMLDNMDLETMREAVRITAGRVGLEVSGGVNLQTVAAIAGIGVNYISIGALTHSAPALDISMEIVT